MESVRVLLADDHEGFRHLLADFLRAQHGVEVVGEASDGAEAISKTDICHPDLVLLDLHMPRDSGFEAAEEIKRRHPETKVIILSTHPGDVYRPIAREHHVDGYIEKSTMLDSLRALLENQHTRNTR